MQNGKVAFYRDGATGIYSANSSMNLNTWTYLAVISNSDGTTSFYIGDENTTPVLSGTADQDAGTPEDGGDLYIGNRSGNDRTFEGAIHGLRIFDLAKIDMDPVTLLKLYYDIYTK